MPEKSEVDANMTVVKCPSCEAPQNDEIDTDWRECQHCHCVFIYDGVGSVIPYYKEAGLSEEDAMSAIHVWASGVKGGREFSRNIEFAKMSLKYYPTFIFEKDRNGNPLVRVAAGFPSAQPGIRMIDLEGCVLKAVTNETGRENFLFPTTMPSAYSAIISVEPSSRKLIFYPFWITQYLYRGRLNTVTVDATNGKVSGDLSVEVERKSQLPLMAAGFVIISASGFLAYVGALYGVIAVAASAVLFIAYSLKRRE
ncbi:MAG: hypothetical protein M1117_02060 [Candidatus Thermoplasmatota archaeon]|nr:hypothetical protein [Candidatus Thermoplasmatota archaeon]